MTISYTITINAARTTTQGSLVDVVKELEWTIAGTDSGQSFSLPNVTVLPDADPEHFTPYASATEAQMVEWVTANEPRLDAIKDHISIVVEKMVVAASLEAKPLPWAPPTPPTPAAPA